MPKKDKQKAPIQNFESQAYTGTQELLDSEAGLIRYNTEIVRKFFSKMGLQKRIIEKNGNLLEFGAGTGFLAEIFRSHFGIKPDCIELDPDLLNVIEKKNLRCFQFLNESPYKYQAIYSSNVLEHIENDSAALEELFSALNPGGIIGIYVPAHPILYSTMDLEIGHVRRYTRSELKKKVENAGFEVQSITYDEFIGFFASLAVKFIGYKNKAGLGSKTSLVIYDKFFYPLSRKLDQLGFRFLIGKNLLLIAVKPSESHI
jgi:SAM-dependent methyltransferase